MDTVRKVFSGARAGQKIVANVYRPRMRPHADGARRVTLLLTHANGFHKELWEPTLQRLFAHRSGRWTIEEAIALDGYNHGDSAVANRASIAGETYVPWFLTARDILAVLSELGGGRGKRAVVGIGHSWGASSLLLAELLSPLSFAGIIATDPILYTKPTGLAEVAAITLKRRTEWASESAAREYFAGHPFFGAWDPRIRDLYAAHGLEASGPGAATRILKCRPENEAAVYRGALYASPFATNNLWRIQCPTAFLTGETSHPASPQHIADITRDMADCTHMVMPGAGHLLLHENPDGTADCCAKLLDGFAPKLLLPAANL
ncbi:hypothetical protein H4R21_000483 [Coemansia helicoidea]|uniref:Uncharacterized protein n=1 Tax=Coemansia helicoidea TaxID=1286919 RepID=A0ACC1LH36_9FUNG|nr:hypothetical protein H4R21_000483 [Coemansia helicoidea]